MKTRALQNYGASVGLEVYDMDWNSPKKIIELGKLTTSQCKSMQPVNWLN